MDLDFKYYPHCQDHLDLTSETLSLAHSKVLFCSCLCPGCVTRVETRTVGSYPEETLRMPSAMPKRVPYDEILAQFVIEPTQTKGFWIINSGGRP